MINPDRKEIFLNILFSSLTLVWFFLPALALTYYISSKRKLKNGALLIANLAFYSQGELWYVVSAILSILLNYGFGPVLDGCVERRGLKKAVFVLSTLTDLGLPGYFKYFNFFLELAMPPLRRRDFTPRDTALSVGISFYIFQSISCLVDTFRGEDPTQRNVSRLALYISLFPQVFSGPIAKYHELKPQIGNRQESLSMHAYGIKRFVYGLVRRMASANMFDQVVDRMFDLPPEQLSTATVQLAVILYSFQIYYDFSDHLDTAIDLGRMFGLTYKENFNYPYLSVSVSEFWRCWHISPSTRLRQYLYAPLRGNREGLAHACVNLFLIFLATGLRYRASTNFIRQGVYYGILVVAERSWLGRILEKNPLKFLNHLYTLGAAIVGQLLFRADTLHNGRVLLRVMLIPGRGLWDPWIFADNRIPFLLVLTVVFCGPVQQLIPRLKARLFDGEDITVTDVTVMVALLLLGILFMVSSTYQAFIYFRLQSIWEANSTYDGKDYDYGVPGPTSDTKPAAPLCEEK